MQVKRRHRGRAMSPGEMNLGKGGWASAGPQRHRGGGRASFPPLCPAHRLLPPDMDRTHAVGSPGAQAFGSQPSGPVSLCDCGNQFPQSVSRGVFHPQARVPCRTLATTKLTGVAPSSLLLGQPWVPTGTDGMARNYLDGFCPSPIKKASWTLLPQPWGGGAQGSWQHASVPQGRHTETKTQDGL